MTSEELMPVTWHPERWFNFFGSEDNMGVFRHFGTENCV